MEVGSGNSDNAKSANIWMLDVVARALATPARAPRNSEDACVMGTGEKPKDNEKPHLHKQQNPVPVEVEIVRHPSVSNSNSLPIFMGEGGPHRGLSRSSSTETITSRRRVPVV